MATEADLDRVLTEVWTAVRARHVDVGLPEVEVKSVWHRRRVAKPIPEGRLVFREEVPGPLCTLEVDGACVAGGPEGVLETLLHVVAHAASSNEFSEGFEPRRFHTLAFKAAAERSGLDVQEPLGPTPTKRGWCVTTLTEATAKMYTDELAKIAVVVRGLKAPARPTRRIGGVMVPVTCQCAEPIRFRIAPGTLRRARIRCDDCGAAFGSPKA